MRDFERAVLKTLWKAGHRYSFVDQCGGAVWVPPLSTDEWELIDQCDRNALALELRLANNQCPRCYSKCNMHRVCTDCGVRVCGSCGSTRRVEYDSKKCLDCMVPKT